jgi:hypothetical protein
MRGGGVEHLFCKESK